MYPIILNSCSKKTRFMNGKSEYLPQASRYKLRFSIITFPVKKYKLVYLISAWNSDLLDVIVFVSKKFKLLSLSGKSAIFILATLVPLNYNIYKNGVKLANFKMSYLNYRKWQKLVLMNTFCVQGSLSCERTLFQSHLSFTLLVEQTSKGYISNFKVQKQYSSQEPQTVTMLYHYLS